MIKGTDQIEDDKKLNFDEIVCFFILFRDISENRRFFIYKALARRQPSNFMRSFGIKPYADKRMLQIFVKIVFISEIGQLLLFISAFSYENATC